MDSSEYFFEIEKDMYRKSWKRKTLILLYMKSINSLDLIDWNYIKRIMRRIKLKKKILDYFENWVRRIEFMKIIT